MKRVGIIGGGASGLVTAIIAKNEKNQVTVLERNQKVGKKILITGNGRCNYWNQDQDLVHYHSSQPEFLQEIVRKQNQEEVLSLFHSIGIVPKIRNGYYYPTSNQASSVREALELEARNRGVRFVTECLVERIQMEGDLFVVETSSRSFVFDELVLATGSKACPKSGSDGSGYSFATSFGHHLTPIVPALVPLIGKGDYFKLWDGVRTDVRLSLFENDRLLAEEEGEIQLTDYGISGICVFNLSGRVAKGLVDGKREEVHINFLPWANISKIEEAVIWLEERNRSVVGRTVRALLEGVLNYKLVSLLLSQSELDPSCQIDDLSCEEKQRLASYLVQFPVFITGTKSYDRAQVCGGGVPFTEIDPRTLESRLINHLYLVGELLDVDGDCGGYNLGFAFLSGLVAGRAIGGADHD